MIEVIEVDGAPVSMTGGYFETIIYAEDPSALVAYAEATIAGEGMVIGEGRQPFLEIKMRSRLPESIEKEILQLPGVLGIYHLAPVLPVLSAKTVAVPFISCTEMLDYNQGKGLELWQLALAYESARGGITEAEVLEKARNVVQVMRTAVQGGLKGTEYHDRILGAQSLKYREKLENGQLVPGDAFNHIVLFVSAVMEMKSSMGVIVAAPTAGSCGTLPGALLGTAHAIKADEESVARALLAAGLIGVFITHYATFAAEVGGCQAECGAASCMSAAAIVELNRGSVHQAVSAASMALQNSLGMICDPIGNRVEAPCLGKNTMAATNALAMANMALADYDQLVPLDQVIKTMGDVGHSMARELRCTGLGGLSVTEAAKEIEARLLRENGEESLHSASRRFKVC